MQRVSITQIASDLGVSAMSVSVALRGKPGVSEKLRARILARAEELGYRPDPVASELMSMVRAQQRAKGVETIAFINTFAEPALFARIPGLIDFLHGAQARAVDYGYHVEQFDAGQRGLSGRRLAEILKARGVRGLLVGPRWRTEPDIDFPWKDFSVMLVGESKYGPNLHRVCNHQMHSCTTLLTALVARGYRRIGLALVKEDEVNHGYGYLLGLEQFRLSAPNEVQVETWLYQDYDEGAFSQWVSDRGLDAVVSLPVQPGELVPQLRTATGEAVGYANLNVVVGSKYSGINQFAPEIGAVAVDMLRSLLLSGERGMAPRPHIVLVEGMWVDGETTRGI
ncbi:MAG: LacI family DNA-binding transcriptional regulator [Opitutus sp.]|nr:LacI family DNA-binding transcriptional regulator [Opitutus sp.]MCS6276357.1 LacI family DNA-binding transcriptional regulator [Opitutus sp.]MCS6301995.1 LacI family DNA-binding transcriptional regulator [Opitutus sp.]